MMDLRAVALRLFQVAVAAADPAGALRRALALHPVSPPDAGGTYILIAVGKAAVPMAEAAIAVLRDAPIRALVVTNYENARDVAGATVMASGHPVPDENGEKAGQAVADLLETAGKRDRVIALISGGGSALLPAPAPGLTLEDKAAVNRLLLANGFEITEINLIRQQLSRLKGGGMLRLAAPAPVTSFILSDVIGDDLRTIASGPTVAPLGTRADARDLLTARGLWDDLPAPVRANLEAAEPHCAPSAPARNHLIGSNRVSLVAVTAACGPTAQISNDRLVGDVEAAAAEIITAATSALRARACLVFGGKTTVTLRGKGKGGRNQELALRVAMAMPDLGRDWAFLSGGTDGRDGPTDAAGGVVDVGTVERIRLAGGDPAALLAQNDSNRALALADDLLVTGATGTNVADVQILMLGART
jgi:hydroxypyruvate reductase